MVAPGSHTGLSAPNRCGYRHDTQPTQLPHLSAVKHELEWPSREIEGPLNSGFLFMFHRNLPVSEECNAFGTTVLLWPITAFTSSSGFTRRPSFDISTV